MGTNSRSGWTGGGNQAAAVIAVLALLAGTACVEEKGSLVVLPSGGGRLDVEVAFGQALSDSIEEEVARGRDRLEEARRRLAGGWRGIAFWSDEFAERVEGRVRYRGSAWFADAGALDFGNGPCRWEARDDDPDAAFSFTLAFDPLPPPGEGKSRREQFADLATHLSGFDVRLRVTLPGSVKVISGPARADGGRTADFRLSEADLREGARLGEEERASRFHRLVLASGPPVAEALVEEAAFRRAWPMVEAVAVPHASVEQPRPPEGPVPVPAPLEPPLAFDEADRFYAVPDSPPDWRLRHDGTDDLADTWSGSLRGSRDERIPVIIRVPGEGRPCPVAVNQSTWHGTKEGGQKAGLPVLRRGVAVVSFDGPRVGDRTSEGRDPLGDDPLERVDNHRWAVADLRALIRALPSAPLPEGIVSLDRGVVVAGVSLGGPTAVTAFALEQDGAAAAVTVVAGAGAYTAARDGEPAGAALEGAGDLRLRTTPESLREAALLDPAMLLPLVRPRPVAIIGGEEDGLAPGSSLRRLARAAADWPEVLLRVHPDVGHFLTEAQQREVNDWIVGQAERLR